MAKLSAHGQVVYESKWNGGAYRAMSDGVILRTWTIDGRSQGWTIARRCGTAEAAIGIVKAWEERYARG